jgi:ubiquinone/menaquinone biosynthesis C-methylase UbiE
MSGAPVVGETDWVLIRDDAKVAYPIVSGLPILLAPEMLGDPKNRPTFDLNAPQYAESYVEMEFYNSVGFKEAERLGRSDSLIEGDVGEGLQHLERLRMMPATERELFPEPADVWLTSRMDLQSEWDSLVHIGAVKGQRLLQLGGSGTAIQALLLAGAAEALLLTPMIGEAQAAMASAKILGVADRFKCLVAVAEEIPLEDEAVDVAFSSGCVHHMRTEIAFPEIARVLRPGGRFAAIEPWRAPFYGIGTRLLGKREANAFCRPITAGRVAPLFDAFHSARYELHGTLSRYPMLGLQKFGIITPMERAWRIGRFDDRVCTWLGLRRFGSGVALLATK